MVCRITSGKGFAGLILYHESKITKGDAEKLSSFNMPLPQNNANATSLTNYFESFSANNTQIKNPTFHVSLNFHKADLAKLDNQTLKEITKEYLEKMGYDKQPTVIYRHFDTDHPHIHVVSSRVNIENGTKINDSFEQFKSNKIRKELEIKYGITIAENQKVQAIEPLKIDEKNEKHAISNAVKGVLEGFNFSSFAQFNSILELYGIKATDVSGERNGKKYEGITYARINDKGEQIGRNLKGSSIHCTLEKVNKKMLNAPKNKELIKPKLATKIATILQNSNDKEQFIQQLKENNIVGLFHKNKDGLVFGVSFIDLQSKAIFSGSELGKVLGGNPLSTKVILEKFEKGFSPEDETKCHKKLNVIYNQLRKGDDYFFESSLIKNLDKATIKSELLKSLVDEKLSDNAKKTLLDTFVLNKKGTINEVLEKEKSYLTKQLDSLLVASDFLVPQLRMDLLNAFGYAKKGNQLTHKKADYHTFGMPYNLNNTVNSEMNLTKNQRDFLKDTYTTNVPKVDKLNSFGEYFKVKSFLKPTTQAKAETDLTAKLLNELIDFYTKSYPSKAICFSDLLLKNGFVLSRATTGEVLLNHYSSKENINFKSGQIIDLLKSEQFKWANYEATKRQNGFIDTENKPKNYQEFTAFYQEKLSRKYKVMSGLQQAIQKNDPVKINAYADELRKYHKDLGGRLEDSMSIINKEIAKNETAIKTIDNQIEQIEVKKAEWIKAGMETKDVTNLIADLKEDRQNAVEKQKGLVVKLGTAFQTTLASERDDLKQDKQLNNKAEQSVSVVGALIKEILNPAHGDGGNDDNAENIKRKKKKRGIKR